MKNKPSLNVSIEKISDLDKINENTKYINIDITNPNHDIITYFINNGEHFLYSDIINSIKGYNYVSYEDFVKAENLIDMIYANMPNNLTKIETAKYLYIAIAKTISSDINADLTKTELYNLSLITSINNLWSSLANGKANDISSSKIFYYLCRRLDIDANIIIDEEKQTSLTKLKINNQILITDLYEDIPYIRCNMRTRYFATYNDDIEIDKKIKYINTKYNDYYIDKALKNIDYTKEECIWTILTKTEHILNIDDIHPTELSIIYNHIFKEYCPNYNIKINNLYLNNYSKKHFIMISYNNSHYSYNYKKKTFVKVNEEDILDNINLGKIGLYLNEYIPNISSKTACLNQNC